LRQPVAVSLLPRRPQFCRRGRYSRYNARMNRPSLLSDFIDLDSALKQDSATDLEDRKRRDRRIGLSLQASRNNAVRQVRGWLHKVSIPDLKRWGYEGERFFHLLCLGLVVAGLVAGAGLARAVLFYTGDRPINIVHALGLLVLPQILLLGLWLLSMFPRRIPLLGALRSALALLNPGRLAARLAALSGMHGRRRLEMVWDPANATLLAPAARWLFSYWSQLFSFSFNVGVLAGASYSIFFSDLAFAWSTTLQLDSAAFHRALSVLSWPWHSLLPDAVPELKLVEISRYYRFEEGVLGAGLAPAELASQLGQWWRFLVAAIVCYGLLPRLLTLLLSRARFRRHLGDALVRLPGAPELLARMNSPLVSTVALEPETGPANAAAAPLAALAGQGYGLKCALIDWTATGIDADSMTVQLHALGIRQESLFAAGGKRSTEQDSATVTSVCESRPQGVVVVVKCWEPPLLDLLDFLRALRTSCSRPLPLIVLLWGGREGVGEAELDSWRRTLSQLQDPDLHLEVIGVRR